MNNTAACVPEDTITVLNQEGALSAKLDRLRTELLDLSARNRLLNTPRRSRYARTIEVVDERSQEIFRLLVQEGRAFTFTPGRSNPSLAVGDDTRGEDNQIA